jgi:hypothetical protein
MDERDEFLKELETARRVWREMSELLDLWEEEATDEMSLGVSFYQNERIRVLIALARNQAMYILARLTETKEAL